MYIFTVWSPEYNCGSPSAIWVTGIGLRSSGVAMGILTH